MIMSKTEQGLRQGASCLDVHNLNPLTRMTSNKIIKC